MTNAAVGGRAFRALTTSFVPEARSLDEASWNDVESIVSRALALRPPRTRRQLWVFVRVVDALALARFGRRFGALDERRRAMLLDALSRSPVLLLRRGVWGLRTLIFMGYYARAAAAAEIGYRATAAGWAARAREAQRDRA